MAIKIEKAGEGFAETCHVTDLLLHIYIFHCSIQGISTSSDSKTSSSILPVSPTLPSLKDALGQHISSTTEIIPTYNGSESEYSEQQVGTYSILEGLPFNLIS
jgi:hypothetical protein